MFGYTLWFRLDQRNHPAFGAAADGAGKVQRGLGSRIAGQYEGTQRRCPWK